MVDTNAPPTSDLELRTPVAGAEHAMNQALVTVATLQKAASAHVTAMIPGAWPARAVTAGQSRT